MPEIAMLAAGAYIPRGLDDAAITVGRATTAAQF